MTKDSSDGKQGPSPEDLQKRALRDKPITGAEEQQTTAPDIEEGQPAHAQPSEIRQRVKKHMKHLLLTGAALGLSGCGNTSDPVVCDPLPPPIKCQNKPTSLTFARVIAFSARWKLEQTKWLVHVSATIHGQPDYDDPFSFSADPTLSGATIRNLTREAQSILFDGVPDQGATKMEITLPLDCNSVAETVGYKLDLSGTKKENQNVSYSVWEPT